MHVEVRAPSEAPNRTTEMAHRDKRANRPKSPLNKTVSDSVSNHLNRQDPANSRAFPDLSSDPGGKSLHPQTQWRWGGAESELVSAIISLIHRENTGKFSDFGLAEHAWVPRFPSVSETLVTDSL